MHAVTRRGFLAAVAAPGFRRGGMLYRRLGKTDLDVSLLGLGSHTDPAFKRQVGPGNVLSVEGQARRDRLVARALDLGVNLVDTYESEGQWDAVARLVKPRRQKILVSICRQFPMFVGENIDRAARLYGHVDLYRIYIGEGAALTARQLADWDVLRKAKAAGKVRAIGIATHDERMMLASLRELEGMDYIMFPYNFIHARADYADFMPAALESGVGLIAIKPVAAGSLVRLDPRAKAGSRPENEVVTLYKARNHPLPPGVVAELTKSVERLPDETLCQAAMRFVYSRPFVACALTGMFEDHTLEENYTAMQHQLEISREEQAALNAAARLARTTRGEWLPPCYRWLDGRWSA